MEINLKACRVNAKMTQADFAKAVEVSPATVYNWEAGKSEPSLSELRKISEVSGIPMDYIAVGSSSFVVNGNS